MKLHVRTSGRTIVVLAVIAVAGLLGACRTVYQPKGATGGYAEIRLTHNSYIVEFSGNGNTSKDAVWNYWLYRCAELAVQKNYSYFAVLPKASAAAPDDQQPPVFRPAQNETNEPEWIEPNGDGGQDGSGSARAPTYIFVPEGGGRPITTWTSKATILMFKTSSEPGARYSLRASAVMEALKPFVTSRGRSATLSSEEIARRAMTFPAPVTVVPPTSVPGAGGSVGRVEMKDLAGLLPK
ncbi:hypothetical protein [Variovorax sp. 770b2]|uniref:CC0125/CC1285 family lipoprotein n=1 Tax=Variovorax sp. 770b2 TaxID=1566271 RepID=UPI0008E3EBAE|nr:hypothetical protein [Variovorax sp. 770b2]SFQ03584.1 hypothetical protein SAMN03159339_5230 [Variovorax sp. 770b2]